MSQRDFPHSAAEAVKMWWFKLPAFWVMLLAEPLALSEYQALGWGCEHRAACILLDDNLEQLVPGSWSVRLAQRCKQLCHTGMCRAWAETTVFTLITAQFKF